jgi:hypothetical protein
LPNLELATLHTILLGALKEGQRGSRTVQTWAPIPKLNLKLRVHRNRNLHPLFQPDQRTDPYRPSSPLHIWVSEVEVPVGAEMPVRVGVGAGVGVG